MDALLLRALAIVITDKAKGAIEQAAKLGGMFAVTLIKEPEAAAMYTLHDLQDKGLEVGDAPVICDAGRWHPYEILQCTSTLELKELVPPKGGMAGSLQLNKRFEGQIKLLVGEDQYHHLRQTRAYQEAVTFFDRNVKRGFRAGNGDSCYVNFPMAGLEDDEGQGLKRDCWELKSSVVEQIFKPLVDDIGRLVDDQVLRVQKKRFAEGHQKGDEVKAIFLVGGFGASAYLRQCIQDRQPDIQVIQPHDAWSAIVKGAFLSQLPNEALVKSVVAPRHYGVAAHTLFDQVRDAGQPCWYEASYGHNRVNKMTWYIQKGEDLQRDKKVIFPFYRRLQLAGSSEQLVFTDNLLSDDSVRANQYPKDGVVKTNCILTADLRSIDQSLLQVMSGADGNNHVDVHYELVVTLQSAQMRFSLERGGREFGSIDAKYESEA